MTDDLPRTLIDIVRTGMAPNRKPKAMENEFRTDNTEGYDETDLKNLNAAWDEITGHGAPTDSDDIGAQSMLQHWSEKLLSEYDAGKRGERLTAWFYA